jgi:secretory carrier-associated membrane protein
MNFDVYIPQDTVKREADIARREAEVNRREAELRRLELELRNAPGGRSSIKNWPKCCPVIHHDIAGDIPANMQGVVKAAYWSFVVRSASLFYSS